MVTTLITLALMVPTTIYVHLRAPGLRRLFESITILPIVIPPVVLIVGVLQVAPSFLKSTSYLLALEYAVLAMPFAYRSLDAGLRAIDLQTLVEASRSLGGGWVNTMYRVVLPNLRSGLLSATVLTVALVLGEYTMASLDQYQSLSVWVVNSDQGQRAGLRGRLAAGPGPHLGPTRGNLVPRPASCRCQPWRQLMTQPTTSSSGTERPGGRAHRSHLQETQTQTAGAAVRNAWLCAAISAPTKALDGLDLVTLQPG